MAHKPHVAVVLAGCGRGDGSEITEAVSCLIHLSRLGATFACFAPDAPQADVVNHVTGKPAPGERRNQMVEAARIARGKVAPLASLDPERFDAVVFPGGFGAAKNLCTFAKDGANCTVIPDVERVVKAFQVGGKPLGMCCIAPVIAARVLGKASGGPGCTVTIGDDAGTAAAVAKMGSTNVVKGVIEAAVDPKNRLTTSPAYMYDDATPHQVFEGIGRMVEGTLKMVRSAAAMPG
ncbi:MAG: isoprenoid biosynthesis glyoxalase ElbB [Phycisphaerales bacterium]|nr:isoprenoid biosynthesis glyoxalase ElbB [Phycisphaerales bacterium]